MSDLHSKPRPAYRHPLVGDVAKWYPAFVEYAAAAPVVDGSFHGPHVAPMVDLERVVQGLQWLAENHAEELRAHPLPTVQQMRAALAGRTGSEPVTEHGTDHDGSPMHNFWHWCHGD